MTAYLLAALTMFPTPGEWLPVEISVYSKSYHGGRTASGERYDHYRGFTAATTVRINDTGSHRPRKAPNWLDLNGHSWNQLTKSKPSRVVGKMRRVK